MRCFKNKKGNKDLTARIIGIVSMVISIITLWFQYINYRESRANLEIVNIPGSRSGIFRARATDVQTMYNCIILVRITNKSTTPISINNFCLYDINKKIHYIQPLDFSYHDLPESIVQDSLKIYKSHSREDMVLIPSVLTLGPAQSVQGFVIYKEIPIRKQDFQPPLFDPRSDSECMHVVLEAETTSGLFKSEDFYLFKSRRIENNHKPQITDMYVRPLL